eukprot:TRINITY_DN16974_c0_g1_i1.p1 TRINITY_DN16974_c0_g1~~TRINITY_DN16974_c0_g1_i1.p1  ORF type:complete len:331 (+),score=47.94 TRINITY_DN16974_c0_g1_i1:20-1012(+)
MNLKRVLILLCIVYSLFAKRFFQSNAIWYQDITAASVSPQSASIISTLAGLGGWGNSNRFQVDLSSFHVLYSTSTTPFVPVVKSAGYYTPDCDNVATFPLPAGGAIEGSTDYTCDPSSDDCHLLVVDNTNRKIYESYGSNVVSGQLHSMCVVVWNMCAYYPNNGRGEQCTSTDAAGFPVTQLLFTADEVASGTIDHAIRFILPNARMRAGKYVHPASHAGGPSGPSNAPVYGNRFRLKSSFNAASYNTAAKVVIAALKKYGMFLADGGNILLSAQSDRFTTAKWSSLSFTSVSLLGISVTDFEVVTWPDSEQTLTYSCVRNTNIPVNSTC